MKNSVINKLSLILVLVLLVSSLAACGNANDGSVETTPYVNAGNTPEAPESSEGEKEHDSTRVFTLDSLEPLSAELQAEIEAAWKARSGEELLWHGSTLANGLIVVEDRYYGTYNGGVAVFHPYPYNFGTVGKMRLAGYEIWHGCYFEILIYKNGEFTSIYDAYESGMITDGDVADIFGYHNEFREFHGGKPEGKEEMASFFTVGKLDTVSLKDLREIDENWRKNHSTSVVRYASETSDGYDQLGDRYYGTYDGNVVFFTHSGMDSFKAMELGGKIISHACDFNLWAYRDGQFYMLNGANVSELFSEESLRKIADYHNQYEEYEAYLSEKEEGKYLRRIFTLDSITPLSDEKRAEVEQAWLEQKGTRLLWCGSRVLKCDIVYDRYYGTFNDGVVIFHSSAEGLKHDGELEISGQRIEYELSFEIYYYKDGVFLDIVEAYANELISADDVASIAEYHNEFEKETGLNTNIYLN